MVEMGLNIKNEEVERLAEEVATRFGESKTEAIRVALKERLDRNTVTPEEKMRRMRHVLETQIWPNIPAEKRGQMPMTKAEIEDILGYGPDGF